MINQKNKNIKGFGRASAYVLEDQTTFIGFDIKTVDNEIWSQQNLFSVDKESKVIGVEGDYKESSDKNVICPLVTSYFEKIDFQLKNHHQIIFLIARWLAVLSHGGSPSKQEIKVKTGKCCICS